MSPERRALVLALGRAVAEVPGMLSDPQALDLSPVEGSGSSGPNPGVWRLDRLRRHGRHYRRGVAR